MTQATSDNKSDNDNDVNLNDQNINDQQFEPNWDKAVPSFDYMNLNVDLIRGIYAAGFQKPSAIQQLAIIPIIQKSDTIVQAESNVDKIVAFSIAALQRLDLNQTQCQVLILAPTDDVAKLIHNIIKSLLAGTYLNAVTHTCLDGNDINIDIQQLTKGVQVVIGTANRVNDIISRGVFSLKCLQIFILDDTDNIFAKGYKQQMYNCYKYSASQLQTHVQLVLFSTIITAEILQLTQEFMINPAKILIEKEELTLDGVKQYYVAVEKEDYKLAILIDLYEPLTVAQAIVYCNTKDKVIWLTDQMKQNYNDVNISGVYNDMNLKERELNMKEFKSGSIKVLITTDLLASYIDVCDVSLVVNYDLPINRDYIHRIGRNKKYVRNGIAINFVIDGDESKLIDIEQFYAIKIEEYG